MHQVTCIMRYVKHKVQSLPALAEHLNITAGPTKRIADLSLGDLKPRNAAGITA